MTFSVLLLCVGLLGGVAAGLFGSAWALDDDLLDDWQRQWRHVLDTLADDTERLATRAGDLDAEARRLGDAARQRAADGVDADLANALAAFERAGQGFARSLASADTTRRLLDRLDTRLRMLTPSALRTEDDPIRDDFAHARRQLQDAAGALDVGVQDLNAGMRLFDDAPGMGHDGLVAYVRDQAQERAFAATRSIAQIKTALIQLRDQRRYLNASGCEADIRARYQTALDALTGAKQDYLNADSVPTEADAMLRRADAAVQAAQADAELGLTRFEECTRR